MWNVRACPELVPNLSQSKRIWLRRIARIRRNTACRMFEGAAAKQAAQSEPVATTTPGPAPTLSPDLEVVKESKLPIMTTLEEFYKIPDGLCTAAARCRHCHHPLLFLEGNGARSQHSDLARGLGRYE
jgi:hypothetical protein